MTRKRPMSPHLQAYRLPLTGLISITHRMTGVFLSMGLLLVVAALTSIASGEQAYQNLQGIMNFFLVKLIYLGFVYALCFHLCHGVRHLIWDTGSTFEKDTLDHFAVIELICSAVLTIFIFIIF